MKTFRVGLSRTFLIDVKANSKDKASQFATFFTSNIQDESTEKERMELQFQIGQIKMMVNDVFEVEEIDKDSFYDSREKYQNS